MRQRHLVAEAQSHVDGIKWKTDDSFWNENSILQGSVFYEDIKWIVLNI